MTNVNVEDVSDVKKRVTFEVHQDKVRDVINTQYNDLKKNLQIKGFRKGKAPLDIIKSYFKRQVEEDARRKLIDETFEEGLKEKQLNAISVLSVDPGPLSDGESFTYTAEIEVPPTIEVTGYSGLDLEKVERKIDESVIDERLDNLRQSHARLIPLDEGQPLGKGDQAVVDIEASTEDGEPIPPLSVTDYHLELDREFYLGGFDDQIVGMTPGETKEIELNLPESYHDKDIAGKKGIFKVTVNEAKTRQLPELDDDFAQDLGEYENLEDLRREIRDGLERNYQAETTKELEDQIKKVLIEKNPFDAPEAMIEARIDGILNQSLQSLAMQGIDPGRLPPPTHEQRERLRPIAEDSVKFGILLDSLAEQKNITISDEEFEKSIEERAEEVGVTPDFMKDQLEASHATDEFRRSLVDQKTIDFIVENSKVTVTEKHVNPYDEPDDEDDGDQGEWDEEDNET